MRYLKPSRSQHVREKGERDFRLAHRRGYRSYREGILQKAYDGNGSLTSAIL
jgi:hypothetical protein